MNICSSPFQNYVNNINTILKSRPLSNESKIQINTQFTTLFQMKLSKALYQVELVCLAVKISELEELGELENIINQTFVSNTSIQKFVQQFHGEEREEIREAFSYILPEMIDSQSIIAIGNAIVKNKGGDRVELCKQIAPFIKEKLSTLEIIQILGEVMPKIPKKEWGRSFEAAASLISSESRWEIICVLGQTSRISITHSEEVCQITIQYKEEAEELVNTYTIEPSDTFSLGEVNGIRKEATIISDSDLNKEDKTPIFETIAKFSSDEREEISKASVQIIRKGMSPEDVSFILNKVSGYPFGRRHIICIKTSLFVHEMMNIQDIMDIASAIAAIHEDDMIKTIDAASNVIRKDEKRASMIVSILKVSSGISIDRDSICKTVSTCFLDKGVGFDEIDKILNLVSKLPKKNRKVLSQIHFTNEDVIPILEQAVGKNCRDLLENKLTIRKKEIKENEWEEIKNNFDYFLIQEHETIEKRIESHHWDQFFQNLLDLDKNKLKKIGINKIINLLSKIDVKNFSILVLQLYSENRKEAENIWRHTGLLNALQQFYLEKTRSILFDYEYNNNPEKAELAIILIKLLKIEQDSLVKSKIEQNFYIERLEKLILHRINNEEHKYNDEINIVKNLDRFREKRGDFFLNTPFEAYIKQKTDFILNVDINNIPEHVVFKCIDYELNYVIQDIGRSSVVIINDKKINLEIVQKNFQKNEIYDLKDVTKRAIVKRRLNEALNDKRLSSQKISEALDILANEALIDIELAEKNLTDNELVTSFAACQLLDELEKVVCNMESWIDHVKILNVLHNLHQGFFANLQKLLLVEGYDFSAKKIGNIFYKVQDDLKINIQTKKNILSNYLFKIIMIDLVEEPTKFELFYLSLISTEQQQVLNSNLEDWIKFKIANLGVYNMNIICDINTFKVQFSLNLWKKNIIYNNWDCNYLKYFKRNKKVLSELKKSFESS